MTLLNTLLAAFINTVLAMVFLIFVLAGYSAFCHIRRYVRERIRRRQEGNDALSNKNTAFYDRTGNLVGYNRSADADGTVPPVPPRTLPQ